MAERENIVTKFFKEGHLLTESALRLLAEGAADYEDRKLPLVVDAQDLQQPFRILKNITKFKSEITREDFIKFYNSKYDRMRQIISARLQKDFTSLNKVDSTRTEVYVIGMVKDIKEKDGKHVIDLEDTTANLPIIFDNIEDVELDDVIAVKAVTGGKVLFGKKIIYPDIPLRNPTTGHGRGCFVSDLRLDEAPLKDAEAFFEWFGRQEIQYLFAAGNTGDTGLFEKLVDRYCYVKTIFVIAGNELPKLPDKYSSSRIISLSNPAILEICGMKILMAQKADIKMLKKRHIGKSQTILDEDYLVLDEVPDIVHSGHSNEPYVTNYKSVTLVNSGSMLGDFKPIVIDFATRDVEKITLPKN